MDARVQVDSRLPDVGVSIFAVMTRLAIEHGAINLSQGFPDFECDPALVEAVHRHLLAGDNQYAPMPGVLALREALADSIAQRYGAIYDPATEITVTSGATEALFDVISAFVRPGDEVMLFEPCYDAYLPVVRLNGGTPRFVTLRAPDYRIDWAEVRRILSPRTRLLVINSPHNPSGAVLDADDMRELADVLDGTDVIVLSDEVYEHIIF
ncbi:MAG: aminotransferase class I/II-fold pyridoxal phosphate-dependent enzyme, partial [Acidobacteriota bacterium]